MFFKRNYDTEMFLSSNLAWLDNLILHSDKKIIAYVYNAFNKISLFISSIVKEYYSNSFLHKLSAVQFAFMFCLFLFGCIIAYYIYKAHLSIKVSKSSILRCFMFLYFILWTITVIRCLMTMNAIHLFRNTSVKEMKILLFDILLKVLIASLVSYLIVGIIFATSGLWYLFYSIVALFISYFIFLYKPTNLKLNNASFPYFFLTLFLFFLCAYFFYEGLNKCFRNIKSSMKNVAIYLPIILLFIFFTSCAEYLQIETLKFLFFPNDKTLKFSFIFYDVLFRFDTNFSKSFLFILCISWACKVFRNLNLLFISSLLSNKLVIGEIKILEALKLCWSQFGLICYSSIYPGFFSTIKATLSFFLTIQSQMEESFVSVIFENIILSLIYVFDGIETFFGNYSQIYFVRLAYNNSMIHKPGSILNGNTEQALDFETEYFKKHPISLVFSTHRIMSIILKIQPHEVIYTFISKINIDYVLNRSIGGFLFPVFLLLNMISETALAIGASIMIHTHHSQAQSEKKHPQACRN